MGASRITNTVKRFIFYEGMMSASKFINNRVQRALNTWLRKGSWKVEVFADGDISQLLVPSGLDVNVVT